MAPCALRPSAVARLALGVCAMSLSVGGTDAFHLPTTALAVPPRVVSVRCSLPSKWSEYNCGTWIGTAMVVNPITAEPEIPYKRTRITVSRPEVDGSVQMRTTVRSPESVDDEQQGVDCVSLLDVGLDLDIDGTYSADHQALHQVLLLTGSSAGVGRVIEHSIAISDENRRRCLLQYSESGLLERAVLLDETRDGGAPAEPMAPCTLMGLLGEWRGDALTRRHTARGVAPRSPGRTAGKGFGNTRPSQSADPAEVNVFKLRLTYSWDGGTTVMRQLSGTAFNGEALEAIRSCGEHYLHEGVFGEYESVRFDGDATFPRMLMLPSGCHVLAPLQLTEGPFQTEFGAELPPGESFGWQGLQEDVVDLPTPEESSAVQTADIPGMDGDRSAARLVRVGRLYANPNTFISGTTSLCTAV